MTQPNQKIGYYEILKNHYSDPRHADAVWDVTLKRLQQIYPEKSAKEILAFLNSESGIHLASEILDGPGCLTYAVVMIRVALLNKMKLAKWWAYHHDVFPVPAPINKQMLYRSAIQNEMKHQSVKDLMIDMLGCNTDTIWPDPETWLNSIHTTEEELEMMWAYIQEKLRKGLINNTKQEETK